LRSRRRRASGCLLGLKSRAARAARPARIATSKQPSRCRSVAERQLSALKRRGRGSGSKAAMRADGRAVLIGPFCQRSHGRRSHRWPSGIVMPAVGEPRVDRLAALPVPTAGPPDSDKRSCPVRQRLTLRHRRVSASPATTDLPASPDPEIGYRG
jgi:hypothetical protein